MYISKIFSLPSRFRHIHRGHRPPFQQPEKNAGRQLYHNVPTRFILSLRQQKPKKSLEYPPNCSRLTQQDLIIRELEEKRRSWADS